MGVKAFFGHFSDFFTGTFDFSRPLFGAFLTFFTPSFFLSRPVLGIFSVFFTGGKFCFTGTFLEIFTGRIFVSRALFEPGGNSQNYQHKPFSFLAPNIILPEKIKRRVGNLGRGRS